MLGVSVVLMILLSTTLVCDAADCNMAKALLSQLEHIRLSSKNDFPTKPISGKLVNYCSSFDRTCCNKGLEQKLAAEISRNFKQDLDYVATTQRKFCTQMKTNLPSAIKDALKESFLTEVIHLMGLINITGNLHKLLLPLEEYLAEFAHTKDICSLPDVIDKQLLLLAKSAFHDNLSSSSCFEATIKRYNAKFVRSIMENMEPLVGKLNFLLKGHAYRNEIIKFMSSYRAPPYCVKSLMLMTFCSTCTHGISPMIMPPCHNLCLNTIQGCLIDFSDLHVSVKYMVKMLDKIKSQLYLSSNIKFVGIKLQRYILGLKNDSSLIKQQLIASQCLKADYKRDLVSNNLLLTPNVDNLLPPIETQTIDLTLADAITDEFKCVQHTTLLDVPNKMCTERYRTAMKNKGCWSASPTTGYTAHVADFSRHAVQANLNPEFQNISMPKMSLLSINITHFVKEMRDMEFQLHCSDDEDCKRFPYLSMAVCKEGDQPEEFSGSGDGSGGTTTIPKTSRINIAFNRNSPSTNFSLPPSISETKPTTTSPSNTSNTINTGDIKNTFSPIVNHENSGISVQHSRLCHLLISLLLLGILYIF